MRQLRWEAFAAICVMLQFAAVAAPAGADPAIEGPWRMVHARSAPWAGPEPAATHGWLGTRIEFTPARVDGAPAIACDAPRYEPTTVPAEGLFQGALPAPAERLARDLGIRALPVAGISLACSSGLYEFHRVDGETLLLALDNVIWTLSRAPGALAEPGTAEGAVEDLLEAHFAADMGFTAAGIEPKRRWLAPGLLRGIDAWFARPQDPNEAPQINGDPFTDSQEYPTRFAVGAARDERGTTVVAVRFADAYRDRVVEYLLRRGADGWRVEDLRYEGGDRFSELLR